MRSPFAISSCLAMAVWSFAFTGSVFAQDTPKLNQLTVLIGTAPGGSFDLVGRVVSRTMQKYIPGRPTIVPQNMPGAGSMIAANYLYTVAPQDGSVIGVINSPSTRSSTIRTSASKSPNSIGSAARPNP